MKRFTLLTTGLLLAVVLFLGLATNPARAQIIEIPCDTDIGPVADQTIFSGEEFAPADFLHMSMCETVWGAEDMINLSVTIENSQITVTYPEGWTGTETITYFVEDYETRLEEYATYTVLPPLDADICGSMLIDDGSAAGGVTVKLIDDLNNQVGEPTISDNNGAYFFCDVPYGNYSVMMVTPLNFTVSPSETQHDVQPANPCEAVDFTLTPITVANDCRTVGYWKHQFDVYLTGHGTAHETEADLTAFLATVNAHFQILGVYTDLENYDFEDAKNVLMVRGDQPVEDGARQQLFALLLNFASNRVGNTTIVSEDGRNAADAVALTARLIKDGDPSNDDSVKTVCETINKGQLVAAGVIPVSHMVYKGFSDVALPNEFRIEQNYPNPFNPTTAMSFALPQAAHVKLQVFDLLGRVVTTVYEGRLEAGVHNYSFDGSKVASGVYLYRLTAGDMTETRKMVLLK
ncbi:MAG: T9SS type A sorting domain-containing protein [Candidatus Zixiibacteriota bacterium]|nr:MAG: T9SS type A sorting domain-containing protein [candidate division Zixibacteria bacterium]